MKMTVKELIELLQTYRQDHFVYLERGDGEDAELMAGAYHEVLLDEDDIPLDAVILWSAGF